MDQTCLEAVFGGLSLCFQGLEDVFTHWPELLEMDLRGNPVCKTQKYRELLTTVCRSLGETRLIFSSKCFSSETFHGATVGFKSRL